MGRFWSLLFLLVPILGVATFVVSIAGIEIPYVFSFHNHWLPENINDHGGIIDSLFYFILYLTGVIFIATTLVMAWFMWKFDAERNAAPARFTHGSHTLEVVWSILPAATLLFIAIFQFDAWADHKLRRPILSPGPDGITGTADDQIRPPLAEVTGRQFEWRIRYAGADGKIGNEDDILTVNDLHVPVDEDVVFVIKSDDVLHSFFLPHMRVKQDVVPGMKQHVWFRANTSGTYDVVCAELCGWGHYKMRGRLTVESRSRFDQWLAKMYAAQEQTQYTPTKGSEDE